ncbi:mercury resistance system transport protein MerF [Rhodobacterales bacterium HKCCA1288]|uniref:mercury resistance system transport protein MerF n=1 Tax=Nereida ignava TaxID=282199 RepID=UPI0019384F88|nr:mercury resistance system transport protein MerF [Paracoccaceae bacterium]QPI84297.1 mercury resistance system transport protein MerF [Rhodobacterales bacterium HKCCA1288]
MTQNIENPDRLLKWGLGGAVFAALCCFTPLLVVVVAGVGLSAFTGWLDYALFPLLFFCLAVVAQALWLRAGHVGPNPKLWATAIAAALSILIIWIEFRFALRITVGAFVAVGVYAFFLNQMKTKGATH